jgi:hypothetical protein
MKWRLEFYNERRGILARYSVEASLPAAATVLGRQALLAEHPAVARRTRVGLFERAERAGGQDPSGWILYRIAQETIPAGKSVTPAPPA